MKDYQLDRFVKAHERDYERALSELLNGRKVTHWMWYIFPQLAFLGMSETAEFYGIEDKGEAIAYCQHPILSEHYVQCCLALAGLPENNPQLIMGKIDAIKLRSSLTLFYLVDEKHQALYQLLLDKYYGGVLDEKTVEFIRRAEVQMRLNDIPFRQIAKKKKTVEVRLYDAKRRGLKEGEVICFTNTKTGKTMCAKIIALYVYDTFQQLFSSKQYAKCGFGKATVEEAVAQMYQIYSPNEEARCGVLGIELELLEHFVDIDERACENADEKASERDVTCDGIRRVIHFEAVRNMWRDFPNKVSFYSETKWQMIIRALFSSINFKERHEKMSTDDVMALQICKRKYAYVEKEEVVGCLVGGAVGDAFGLPVEFLDDGFIFQRYGEKGITEMQLYQGIAHISDDTQMTLFTADGLLTAAKRFEKPTAENYVQCVYEAYLDWLYTQDESVGLSEDRPHSELLNVQELFSRRAPGNACMNSLRSGQCGTLDYKLNDSKGCGGIMRVAPVALYFSQFPDMTITEKAMMGARVAAITHSHELGYIPAAFLTALLCQILNGGFLTNAVWQTCRLIERIFSASSELKQCIYLVTKAMELAESEEEMDDLEALRMLGEGWVAEETLAIAIYCACKYSDDFEAAMIAAANHSGDSDSTAAVTGNILGAYLGIEGIPQKMWENLEIKDVIVRLAEKLHVNKLTVEIE